MNDKWAQAIQYIPKQSRVRDTWRKRRRGNRGVYALSHSSAMVRPAPRASRNSDPTKSANTRSICQTRNFLRSITWKLLSSKVHSTREKNGSRRLKEKLLLSTKRLLVQDDTCPEHKSRSEILSTPSSLKPRSIRGLMMKSCT